MLLQATSSLVLGLCFLAFFFSGKVLSAESQQKSLSNGKNNSRLLVGSCELEKDPREEFPTGNRFCVRGKAGLESVVSSGPAREDILGFYVDGYLGAYFNSWFSLASRGRGRKFFNPPTNHVVDEYKDSEYAVVQFGNQVLHRFRLTLGHLRPAFGVDRIDIDEFYRASEDRRFWPGPAEGVTIALDDMRATTFEFSWAKYPDEDIHNPTKKSLGEVFTTRIMRDFAGNGSTRLVFSGALGILGLRDYGFGVVNISQNKDQLVFEVVRRLPQPDGNSLPFDDVNQVLRIGYIGSFVEGARWIFHFDEEKYRFRRGLFEFNKILFENVILRAGISYKFDITEEKQNRWFGIVGFEERL